MVKKSMKKLFVGLAAFSAVSISASSETLATSRNFFAPRAFSANLAREMLMEGSKHRVSDSWYGEFSATAAYQRQWSQDVETTAGVDLAESVNGMGAFPFWSGTNVMTVGTNNGASSLDAYQFGLGNVSANGSITLNPVVYQAGADFMFVVASAADEPCFFAKIKAPVGVYNINPNLTEVEATPVVYAIGALQTATATTTLADPALTMTQAFAGKLAGGQVAEGAFVPMANGLIAVDQSTGAKFGDIDMTVGYRFVSNADNSFSVAVRASAPTGNKATGEFMLEPIFGKGGNWALGGYVDGHMKVWEGNNDNSFQIKLMANAQHLFEADTVRSFDLTANGVGSKYLLVANYSDTAFGGTIQNLINVSTLACNSSFAVEGDAAVSFAYVARGWTLDLGYEFWGRSAETLEITGAFADQTWAVLGRQGITNAGGTANTNLCQPTATMGASAARVDVTDNVTVLSALTPANRISVGDFNQVAAQQDTAMTSKVFSKVSYEWTESDYKPHLGVMGEFEISNSNNNALPQWGVSLVGGVSF